MRVVDHDSIEDAEVFEGIFSKQVLNKKVGGSAAITVGELKLKPGAVLPAHIHGVEEALIVVEGQGEVISEDETQKIRANMTILAPAGRKHQIKNTGTEMLKIYYTFPAVEVERILV
jgi:quercetin dioxygenase-like cupin family protein